MAGTTLGISLDRDFSNDLLWYGGYLRTGGLFKLELAGSRSYSGSKDKINLFSYFLMNLNLGSAGTNTGSLNLYFGASPDMTISTSTPSFSVSNSTGYGKLGLEYKLFPFSIQVESRGKFDFSGNLKNLLGGVGFGLSF
jgi:hypothetical protein